MYSTHVCQLAFLRYVFGAAGHNSCSEVVVCSGLTDVFQGVAEGNATLRRVNDECVQLLRV